MPERMDGLSVDERHHPACMKCYFNKVV